MNIKPLLLLAIYLAVASCGMHTTSNPPVVDMNTASYFSSDYFAARQTFLDNAFASEVSVVNYQNPHPGPDGRPLFTDVAVCGPKEAENALVLMSGLHGVEGFAGSGIQSGLLGGGVCDRLPPKTRLIMVHALNPFGFASLRRVNEDNIDLNRNFVDHSRPYPANPEYDNLAALIAPSSLSFLANFSASLKIFWYRLVRGTERMQKAVTFGQYSHPSGLFFGGNKPSWSNRTLHEVVGRYLSGAKKVAVVDFHTGLGPYGYGEIILNEPEDEPSYQRALSWWGRERVKSTVAGGSVSSHLSGTMKLAFANMLPEAEVTAAGLEFGTLPPLKVFLALRAENWLYHHGGDDHPDASMIKQQILDAFYPDDDNWKARVWQQGQLVVSQALDALAE